MKGQDFGLPPVAATEEVRCNYCGHRAQLVTGKKIYPNRPDLFEGRYWHCEDCQAWVGTHGGTYRPLGILANAELRALKMRVHALFDQLWKYPSVSGSKNPPPFFRRRRDAYLWLAEQMGITPTECHVGLFPPDRCRHALRLLRKQWELLGWRLPAAERE